MPGCQFHHPRLDHHPPRPEPAEGIAFTAAPVPRKGCHRLGAPAMRVEPAASSFPATDPAGVPAGPAHGKLNLAREGQIVRIAARSRPSGTAGPDADIVAVVACHEGTIGIRFIPRKSLQVPVVPWRNNTCSSVKTAEPAMPHRAAAIRLNVESKRKNASDAIPRTFRSAAPAPRTLQKTMCRQPLTPKGPADHKSALSCPL